MKYKAIDSLKAQIQENEEKENISDSNVNKNRDFSPVGKIYITSSNKKYRICK